MSWCASSGSPGCPVSASPRFDENLSVGVRSPTTPTRTVSEYCWTEQRGSQLTTLVAVAVRQAGTKPIGIPWLGTEWRAFVGPPSTTSSFWPGPYRTRWRCGTCSTWSSAWLSTTRHCDTASNRERTTTSGKDPAVRDAVLGWNAASAQDYKRFGATLIDATRPLKDVVDDVVTAGRGPLRQEHAR